MWIFYLFKKKVYFCKLKILSQNERHASYLISQVRESILSPHSIFGGYHVNFSLDKRYKGEIESNYCMCFLKKGSTLVNSRSFLRIGISLLSHISKRRDPFSYLTLYFGVIALIFARVLQWKIFFFPRLGVYMHTFMLVS